MSYDKRWTTTISAVQPKSDRFCGHIVAAAPQLRPAAPGASSTFATSFLNQPSVWSLSNSLLLRSFATVPSAMWWGNMSLPGLRALRISLVQLPPSRHWEMQAKKRRGRAIRLSLSLAFIVFCPSWPPEYLLGLLCLICKSESFAWSRKGRLGAKDSWLNIEEKKLKTEISIKTEFSITNR